MQVEKIACGAWLKSLAGARVIHWVLNPGNAGDSLITAATEVIFRKAGVNFQIVSDPGNFDSKGKFVCYSGGGNLVSHYEKARQLLHKYHEGAARLVILPHTIEGNEDLLAELSSRVTIICRELVSYAHCRTAAPKAEVLAADDLALCVKPRDLSGWRLIPSALAELGAYASLRRVFGDFVESSHGETELTVWRGDRERHPSRRDPPLRDLSRMFALNAVGGRRKRRNLNRPRLSAYFFLRSIDRFSLVRTDRLHVAIGAVLLGKDVELYSNEYYKNRAVYDFSLSSLRNVRFMDWE